MKQHRVDVTLPNGEASTWNIVQNLTDRWGELNYHRAGDKPLEALETDEDLLDRLRAQMCGEMTFVVQKDGQFGLLFEYEYASFESEEGAGYDDPSLFPPHQDVVQRLVAGISRIADQFPGVDLCVPDASQIIDERPAVWAFVNDGQLDEAQREALADALANITTDPEPALSLSALYRLWDKLGEVPVDDSGSLQAPFEQFGTGISREEVWHWMEAQNHRFSVGKAMDGTHLSSDQDYVRTGACPRCGAETVEHSSNVVFGGDFVHQEAKCEACGFEWNNHYELTGFDKL